MEGKHCTQKKNSQKTKHTFLIIRLNENRTMYIRHLIISLLSSFRFLVYFFSLLPLNRCAVLSVCFSHVIFRFFFSSHLNVIFHVIFCRNEKKNEWDDYERAEMKIWHSARSTFKWALNGKCTKCKKTHINTDAWKGEEEEWKI